MKPSQRLNKSIDRAKAILKSHGIQMEIFGCGCCGSPEVRMHYQGVPIIEVLGRAELEVNFDMFEDDSQK